MKRVPVFNETRARFLENAYLFSGGARLLLNGRGLVSVIQATKAKRSPHQIDPGPHSNSAEPPTGVILDGWNKFRLKKNQNS